MRFYFFLIAGLVIITSTQARPRRKLEHHASAESRTEMIVTGHPLATEAGQKILEEGGTAVDALVAVQTVLGLVEPQSSGLGGGAFCVYWDEESKKLTTFDGREAAPKAATEERFLNQDTGIPYGFIPASQSALSVGVPGVPKLLWEIHSKYGTKPWDRLFTPAINLASNGFEISETLSNMVTRLLSFNPSCETRFLFHDPDAFEYLVDYNEDDKTCSAKPAGTVLKNDQYVETLTSLGMLGADTFYKEDQHIPESIVSKLETAFNPTSDATIAYEDLASYEVVEREPVCQTYGGVHKICGMGPPSSGGLAVGQIFGILENFKFDQDDGDGPLEIDTIHVFLQAMRLAFADRNKYVGDSDFVSVPVDGMLDKDYLKSKRANLIDSFDMGVAEAGSPPGLADPKLSPQTHSDEGGTSHISIVDRYGNALSMTSSVEMPFGSGYMVCGLFLNNQLTDFSFVNRDQDGIPIANRVEGGKRPRSSMSPTIVMDTRTGKVSHLVGSPGGARIIGFVARVLTSMLDFDMNPFESIHLPHALNQNGLSVELENLMLHNVTLSGFDYEAIVEKLTMKNYKVDQLGGPSGLGVIKILSDGTLLGAADLRREGSASGRPTRDFDDDDNDDHVSKKGAKKKGEKHSKKTKKSKRE